MNKFSERTTILLAVVCFVLYSCSPASYRPLFKTRSDRVSDTLQYVHVVNPKSPGSDVYRIQSYDVLSVRNIKIEQIESGSGGSQSSQSAQQGSGTEGFRVEVDGNVNLPIIGQVYVKGLTRKEATDKIQGMYKMSYLKDPVIDVSVIAPKVTILGEVQSQGTYILQRENVSLVEIIGNAGGLTQRADPKTLKIIRGEKSNPEIIYVNLGKIESLASPKMVLQNNDVIYVEADKKYNKYEKSQSGFGIFQSVFVIISTGLLVFTTFFK
jgi:polysaccharide export outer membrane protein